MLLDNVLSFEVLVDWTPSRVTGSIWSACIPLNGEYPFDSLGTRSGGLGAELQFHVRRLHT